MGKGMLWRSFEMGMSTHVVGIRLPDKKWKAMKEIWDKCEEHGVDPPKEVGEFFDWEPPDERGVVVDVKGEEWSGEMCSGYEVKIGDLPKGIHVIRFFNSW